MHASAVMLLASVISPYLSSIVTLKTAFQISMLYNGMLLLSLKLVIVLLSSVQYFYFDSAMRSF